MKNQYIIDVQFTDGTYEILHVNESTIQKEINVIKYVESITCGKIIAKILTQANGEHNWNLNYHYEYEHWKKSGYRIEAENDPGYEDYTGYGNRTDGKRNRFYIGKSTGWAHVYLEILKSNSNGGSSLDWKHRKFKVINYKNRRS